MRLFSTEQVSKYHPDKYADQISDAILDACLEQDICSKVSCECMVKDDTVAVFGNINSLADINYEEIVRKVAKELNYTVNTVITNITKTSFDNTPLNELVADDQGTVFGYACNDTHSLLPYGFFVANNIIKAIEFDIDTNSSTIFKGPAKCQVIVDLDSPKDKRSLVKVSLDIQLKKQFVNRDYISMIISQVLQKSGIELGTADLVVNVIDNETSKCGLTGRKIVSDQYGGYSIIGNGALSGKSIGKIDRSATYMARTIACELLKEHNLSWCQVQLTYIRGEKFPVNILVNSNDSKQDLILADEVSKNYDLSLTGIIRYLHLVNIKYQELAKGCHYLNSFKSSKLNF